MESSYFHTDYFFRIHFLLSYLSSLFSIISSFLSSLSVSSAARSSSNFVCAASASASSAFFSSSACLYLSSVRYSVIVSDIPKGLCPRTSTMSGKFIVSFSRSLSPSASILSLCSSKSSFVKRYYSFTMFLTSSSISQFVQSLYGFWKDSSPPIEP